MLNPEFKIDDLTFLEQIARIQWYTQHVVPTV